MRIAVIGDIHGGLEALEAVLQDIECHGGVDRYFVLGDIVGYGPDPLKCMEIVSRLGPDVVLGNHDEAVIQVIQNPEKLISLEYDTEGTELSRKVSKGYAQGINLAVRQIFGKNDNVEEKDFAQALAQREKTMEMIKGEPKPYQWLKTLRRGVLATTDLGKIIIAHDNPRLDGRYIVGKFDPKAQVYLDKGLAYDYLDILKRLPEFHNDAIGCAYGDSHIPAKYTKGGRFLLNPGSTTFQRVKQKRNTNETEDEQLDRITIARYAMIDTKYPGELRHKIRLLGVRFDWEKTRDKMIKLGLPDKFKEVLA